MKQEDGRSDLLGFIPHPSSLIPPTRWVMPNKMKEFRGMSDEQLSLALKDTEKHLFQLRFQSATDRLETPSEIRKAKRDIARIKTLQREKELAELEALPPDELAKRIAGLDKKVAENVP